MLNPRLSDHMFEILYLKEFLSNPAVTVSVAEADNLFGWPKVDDYASNFFRVLEESIQKVLQDK